MSRGGEQTLLKRLPITRPVLADDEEVVGLVTEVAGRERRNVTDVFRGHVIERVSDAGADFARDVYAVRYVAPPQLVGKVQPHARATLYATGDSVEAKEFRKIVGIIWRTK